MRGVAYVRVSTREQDEEVQRRAIEDFARRRGIEIVGWYVDKGESGAKPFKSRPGARRLLEELEGKRPDVVVAWSLDRLGRTMLDTLSTVMELEDRGYRVVTVKEEWLQTLDDSRIQQPQSFPSSLEGHHRCTAAFIKTNHPAKTVNMTGDDMPCQWRTDRDG